MKKILLFIISIFTIISLVGCNKKEPTNENTPVDTGEKDLIANQVKLKSFNANNTSVEKITSKAKMGFKLSDTTPTYQFVVLVEDEINLELVIKLDNPKDYHIFDFTLECDDNNAKVLVNEEYKLLTELQSINWRGDTNSEYKISMQISSEEYLTTINLTSMYYSDRETGENKYEVDLDNKGTVSVYRVNEGLKATIVDYETTIFELNDEHIDTNSIKVNGNNYELGSEYIEATTTYNITYDYIVDENMKSTGSMIITKDSLEISITKTYAVMILELNPIYIDEDGMNVKMYLGDTLIEEGIVTKENTQLYLRGKYLEFRDMYFVVDDKYIIGK